MSGHGGRHPVAFEDNVEAVADRIGAGRNQRVAATQVPSHDTRQRDGDPLAGLSALHGSVMHLDRANSNVPSRRLQSKCFANLDRPRPSLDDRAAHRAAQRDVAVETIARYNPQAVVCVGIPFGHTRPQWILPYGGEVTVDGASHAVWADYR